MYTNYKTGKPCSRAENIRNGLERGELLYKYDCGCVIIQDFTADAYIVYCPKHEVAPDMYEALKDLYIYRNVWKEVLGIRLTEKLLKALSKAEGGK